MLWLLRIVNVLILLWGTLSYMSNRDNLPLVLAGAGFLFFVSALYKAFTVGRGTLRGRFWMLFSMVGLSVGFAGLLHSLGNLSLFLHALSRIFLASTILMMFLGLVKRSLSPRGWRVPVVLLAFMVSMVVVFYALIHSSPVNVWDVLIGMSDILVFTFTVSNLLVYLGSDLGKRWFIGFLAVFVYILADIFFLTGKMDQSLYALVVSLFLISIVAHIGE